ncbi:MAG: hypothetical protein GY810_22770 [Aureispira sp.]|nr:hypothetical protein [Aureispira sp.]
MSRFVATVVCICFVISIYAQQKTPYAPYGGVFTPKGDLKALIVFVTFKDHNPSNKSFRNQDQHIPKWDINKNKGLPEFVDANTGACPTYIFNKPSDFTEEIDNVKDNFSKTFYLASNKQFRFMGEVFSDANGKPTVVEIDPTGGRAWTNMNKKALKKMREINPKYDLSKFDQRKNNPNFRFDNSDVAKNPADKVVDYVVFIYRYSNGWRQQPAPGMNRWVGSTGGFASTGLGLADKYNGYQFNQGFTMKINSGVFVHEIAHTLFNAPHLMGVNGVVGDYFYMPTCGWGTTNPIAMLRGFNAWERWYMGFIDPIADIKTIEDLKEKDEFILKDFVTEGHAIRITIPFSGGQHLWLENHTGQHFYDKHIWHKGTIGKDVLGASANGVYAYIENIASTRNEIFSALSNKANGIKLLNASGNYDYLKIDTPSTRNGWNNEMFHFRRLQANPISGMNRWYCFKFDSNNDGKIHIDKNYNQGKCEYQLPMMREEVAPGKFEDLYGSFGCYDAQKSKGYTRSPAFLAGDRLDMGSNPMITNYSMYNIGKKALEPTYLNGLSVSFEAIANSKDIKVKIAYKQTKLNNDTRWTGNIILPNITEDALADLEISSKVQLELDRSGIINRHIKDAKEGFVNPTVLTVAKDAKLRLRKKSQLVIKNGSSLVLEKGALLLLDRRSKIVIEPTGTLNLNGFKLKRKRLVKVQKGGQLIN